MPIQRELKRKFTITKKTEGYVLTPPKRRGLVLSGGGAKGIGYAGLIRAMEEYGQLKELTHVSGASAGAMTASLLAVGFSAADCEKLVNEFDLFKLLDKEGLGFRAEGKRFRNVLELLYLQQIKQHLKLIQQPLVEAELIDYKILSKKIEHHEKALEKVGLQINSLQDVIDLTKDKEKIKKLDRAFDNIFKTKKTNTLYAKRAEDSRLNFLDLQRLRTLLPESKKHLIKNLSVVTTNQTKNQLQHYNESLNANASIAEMVQLSGAHPLLFTPVVNAEGDAIADGGIIDNMPTEVLEGLGLKKEEIFCAKIEEGSAYEQRIQRAQNFIPEYLSNFYSFLDTLARSILGGEVFKGRAEAMNREKVFYYLENMIYINSGSLSTVTTKPTAEQRKFVIQTAYQQTKELLENQIKVFDNALIAILYLGREQLDNLLVTKDRNNELFINAGHAKAIFFLQSQLVDNVKEKKYALARDHLKQLQEQLGTDSLNETQFKEAMSLCLKQINFMSEGLLEQYLIKQLAESIEAQDKNEINFFVRLLSWLYTPIAWIISQLTTTKTNTEEKAKESTIAKEKVVEATTKEMSLAELCGLFAHKVNKAPVAKSEETLGAKGNLTSNM